MPPQEQADVWMALRDRMKTNWAELTLQEKKAGTFPFLRRMGRGDAVAGPLCLTCLKRSCGDMGRYL